MEITRFAKPYQLRAADGTIVWLGAAWVCNPLDVTNSDTTAVIQGESCRINLTSWLVPRWDYAGTDDPADGLLNVVRSGAGTAGAEIGHIGVAIQPIAVGKSGVVAGSGTITCVKTTATLLVEGNTLVNSAVIGQMLGSAAQGAAVPLVGAVLGVCIKANAVASPGTGSLNQAGVFIGPR